MKTILTLVFLLLSNMPGLTQENPADPLKKLDFLIGDWTIENFKSNTDGSWESMGSSASAISWDNGDRFIREMAKHLTQFGEINMLTYIAFDSRLNGFKLTAMDKEYGLMDVYHGEYTSNRLVFTNLESDIPIKMQDGKQLSFRLTYTFQNDQKFSQLVEGTYDKGENWFVFARSDYTRSG